MRLLGVLLALVAALIATPASAQTFPKLTGRVVDAANIIPPAEEAQLTADLDALQKQNGQQFVIATVPSLEGRPIEDYGYRLGRAWGIGRKEINDGVILLVAPAERKVRIEVGYGLTPILTNGLTGLIVEKQILPRFRDGDMPGGIRAGADAVLAQLRLPAPQAEARAKRILAEQAKEDEAPNWLGVVVLVILFFAVIFILSRARGGRSYRGGGAPVIIWGGGDGWGSGSSWGSGGGSGWSGGGGFSGGGGSFGGGGASGDW